MACIINASTSAGLVQTADLSGQLQLQSNGVAVTVPAVAGTMMVSGNMPAFSAYPSASQSLTSSTFTLVTLDMEQFDTASAFNNTGSTVGNALPYGFNPQVAGYYQVNTFVGITSSAITRLIVLLYKNGTNFSIPADHTSAETTERMGGSTLVYMNGTTDCLQMYCYATATSPTTTGGQNALVTYFQGSLVRAA
jgi:hypothetical protein